MSIVLGAEAEWNKRLIRGEMSEEEGCAMVNTQITEDLLNWIKRAASIA